MSLDGHVPGGALTSVDSYRALDLSEGAPARKQLFSRLEGEAASSTAIDLTRARLRYNAQTPGGLTPAMSAWYAAWVAGPRGKAISELQSSFHAEKMPPGVPNSTFLEVRRDDVRSQSLSDRIEQTTQFLDHNRALIDGFYRARLEFNTLKARHGREPVPPRPLIYVFALLLLVALEAFINFESFLKVPYITSPFLATGATMAVAAAIAAASHFHGVVLRQWNYLFSPQDPGDKSHPARQSDATRRLVIGAVLLSVALAMVAGSRYYYLREYIVQARILGSSPPSMFGGIAFMLFGNIVAYLVAVLVAYGLHDPDPNYAEKDREFKRATKAMERIKAKRRLQQEAQRQGLDNAIAQEVNQASNTRGPNHAALRGFVEQIVEKDQEVVAVLLDYRNALIQAQREAGADEEPRLRLPEGAYEEIVPVSLDRLLTPREFASEPLTLGFSSGER